MAELVRVNARISSVLNDWLDEQSAKTGISKSTLIMMAVDKYKEQSEAMRAMADMGAVMEKLEQIEKQLPSGK